MTRTKLLAERAALIAFPLCDHRALAKQAGSDLPQHGKQNQVPSQVYVRRTSCQSGEVGLVAVNQALLGCSVLIVRIRTRIDDPSPDSPA